MFTIDGDGKAIAVSTSRLRGPIPVAVVWRICHTDIVTHGVTIQSAVIPTMVSLIIIRAITAGISMSVLAGTGPVGIDIAGTTGMAAIPITGTAHMSSLNRIRM